MTETKPPANLDAEKAVLGGILLDNDVFLQASELEPVDFSTEAHRRMFLVMQELSNSSQSIDSLTLAEHLGDKLQAVGGHAAIAGLIDGLPDRPSIESYVQIVKQKSALRQIIGACNIAIAEAIEPQAEALAVARRLDELITRIGGKVPSRAKQLGELIKDVLEDMARERTRKTEWIGIPTGIDELDSRLGGIRRAELWIVGGLPSSGKTSLALEHGIAANTVACAEDKLIPTCMFSMEMKDKRIVRRILAGHTAAGATGARDARSIPDNVWLKVADQAAQLGNLPLWIDDSTGLSIPSLRSAIRRYKKEFGVELVLVDYVGLMDGPGRNITEQATGIAKGLQRIAKEEDVAILALSQLSRPGEPNERPTMQSLRNSGDFEANADVVLLIYRPMDLDTSTFLGEDEIIIGKARDGARGFIPVIYNENRLLFQPRFTGAR